MAGGAVFAALAVLGILGFIVMQVFGRDAGSKEQRREEAIRRLQETRERVQNNRPDIVEAVNAPDTEEMRNRIAAMTDDNPHKAANSLQKMMEK